MIVLLLNWIVFGLGVFLGKATLSHYLLKEIMWLHFSFTWLIHPLHFNLFTIYEINISGRYELFKHWRDKSHSTRWLQAFTELVRFVVLSLKSNWRGRWTTKWCSLCVNNICLYFYKKVYMFPRKWSWLILCEVYFSNMGHVFPWKRPWEFVCELYFSIFSEELCICLKDKDDIISLKIIMRTFEL